MDTGPVINRNKGIWILLIRRIPAALIRRIRVVLTWIDVCHFGAIKAVIVLFIFLSFAILVFNESFIGCCQYFYFLYIDLYFYPWVLIKFVFPVPYDP